MAEEWNKGDLAVRVAPPVECPACGSTTPHDVGSIHTVEDVKQVMQIEDYMPLGYATALLFVGEVNFEEFEIDGALCSHDGYAAANYMKVTPREEDEFDREVIDQYRKVPERVSGYWIGVDHARGPSWSVEVEVGPDGTWRIA